MLRTSFKLGRWVWAPFFKVWVSQYWIFVLFACFAFVYLGYSLFWGSFSFFKLSETKKKALLLERRVKLLEHQNADYQRKVLLLGHTLDLHLLEDQVRYELKYVSPKDFVVMNPS